MRMPKILMISHRLDVTDWKYLRISPWAASTLSSVASTLESILKRSNRDLPLGLLRWGAVDWARVGSRYDEGRWAGNECGFSTSDQKCARQRSYSLYWGSSTILGVDVTKNIDISCRGPCSADNDKCKARMTLGFNWLIGNSNTHTNARTRADMNSNTRPHELEHAHEHAHERTNSNTHTNARTRAHTNSITQTKAWRRARTNWNTYINARTRAHAKSNTHKCTYIPLYLLFLLVDHVGQLLENPAQLDDGRFDTLHGVCPGSDVLILEWEGEVDIY